MCGGFDFLKRIDEYILLDKSRERPAVGGARAGARGRLRGRGLRVCADDREHVLGGGGGQLISQNELMKWS